MYTLFDDIFNHSAANHIQNYVNSYNRYALGWSDTPEKSNLKYIHGWLNRDDMEQMKFFSSIKNKQVLNKIANRDPTKVVINVSFPGYFYNPHLHQGEESLIYYVNTSWDPEWSGETMVYDEYGKNIHACIPFSPGKILWLEKDVVHSMRPPSLQAPFYRFSISMFFQADEQK